MLTKPVPFPSAPVFAEGRASFFLFDCPIRGMFPGLDFRGARLVPWTLPPRAPSRPNGCEEAKRFPQARGTAQRVKSPIG